MSTVTAHDVTGGTAKPTQTATITDALKQTATVEGVASSQQEEKPVDLPKEDPQLSKRLAAIAREQKAVRDARRKLDAERQSHATLAKELEELRTWKARLGQDPLNALNDVGISYEQLTQSVLNSPDPTVQRLLNEVDGLKKAQAEKEKRELEQTEAGIARAVAQIKNDAKVIVDNNPSYEMIQLHGDDGLDIIAEIIRHDFNETGIVKSVEEVANEVEAILADEALKYAKSKKIQNLLTPKQEAALAAAEQKQTEKQQSKPEKPHLTTLSNIISPTTKPVTAKERRDRAIAAFMGQKL